MISAATTYPKIYENKLINLEQKINICLKNNMNVEPYLLESNNLLSLSSFMTYLSKGLPMNVSIEGEAQEYFKRGKEIYFERIGQMNLACNQCHDNLAGNYLRAEKIIIEELKKARPYYSIISEEDGSETNKDKVGAVKMSDLKAIAERKMADLNANTIDQALSMMMGTGVSMGIEVEGK